MGKKREASSDRDRPDKLKQARQQLPIWAAREDLLHHLKANRTLVLIGETGSGKTTQLPQFLIDGGACFGAVACTQPRRVAAVSVATRVAKERGVQLGQEVSTGYCPVGLLDLIFLVSKLSNNFMSADHHEDDR